MKKRRSVEHLYTNMHVLSVMTSPYLIIPYKVYAFVGKVVTNVCGCTILSCGINEFNATR